MISKKAEEEKEIGTREKKRLHNAGKENRMVIRSDEHIGVKKEEEKIEKEEKRRKKESREERV